MRIVIVSYRRSRHVIHPNQAILKVIGVEDKKSAYNYVGKKVKFTTKSGKSINGVVTAVHGDNGRLRARFDKGLPGQAIGREVLMT